jgi:hypothetical protein
MLKQGRLGFEKMWMWMLGIVSWLAVEVARPLWRPQMLWVHGTMSVVLPFANSDTVVGPSFHRFCFPADWGPWQIVTAIAKDLSKGSPRCGPPTYAKA